MAKSVFTENMPTQITEDIQRFCESVASGQKPTYVPVLPVENAEAGKCHINVEEHVKLNGGKPVYGWIIWQSPALLHAEFHANWMDNAGNLIDITPKADGEKRILFLPDPSGRWEGRLVPSRRKARRFHPLLSRWLSAYGEMDRIRAKYLSGELASSFDTDRVVRLMVEIGMHSEAISKSWSDSRKSLSAADRRALKKAARQRRKEQQRRQRRRQ